MTGIIIIFFSLFNTVSLYILSKSPNFFSVTPLFKILNQIDALLGATLLAVSFILVARWKVLERLFGGFDKTYRIHHICGAFAFMFLVNHPLFLILNTLPNTKVSLIYVVPSIANLPYLFGIAALWSMILFITLTLFVSLPYHIWKRTHELFGVTLFLGLLHVFTISSDVSSYLPLRIWMLGLMGLAACAYIYIRFLYRFIGPKSTGVVTKIVRTLDIIDIFIKPDRVFNFTPGQFVFLSVKNKRLGTELHPFSFSSAPSEQTIRLTVKIDGDYTLQLRQLTKGDLVTLHGPHGNFADKISSARKIILIGGGIGITPFVSIIKHYTTDLTDKEFHCFYSVRDREEAYFNDELSVCALAHPGIHYYLHTSKNDGRLTATKIYEQVGGVSDALVLICGPQKMMESLADQFAQLSVRKSRINFEDFALR